MRRALPKDDAGSTMSKKKGTKSTSVMDRIEECDRNGQYNLDLSNLHLSDFPKEAVLVGAIKYLNIHKNKIVQMPTLEAFRGLIDVDLSRNMLMDLSQVRFCALKNLKKVDLSRNALEHLPDDMTMCASLETLIIHRNILQSLPDGISNMRSLVVIDASFNNIKKIGSSLENLFNLEELNLTNNEELDTEDMGTRTRRLYDKVILLCPKKNRADKIGSINSDCYCRVRPSAELLLQDHLEYKEAF